MQGPIKWTEAAIARLEAEGRGRGQGPNYEPWLRVGEVSSAGRSRRIWSPKMHRTVHLLSDVEYGLFIALEYQEGVVDIREQYPLDRAVTQDIARELGLRHPAYPRTHIPVVMTVDFLVSWDPSTGRELEAYDAKRDEKAADERSIAKLEIQREYFARLGVPHHLVFHCSLPQTKLANIDWVRDALLKENEVEPHAGYFSGLQARMTAELGQHTKSSQPLNQYCADFDARHGKEPGTALRVARMLMQARVLKPDLSLSHLESAPLSAFAVAKPAARIRAVGGL